MYELQRTIDIILLVSAVPAISAILWIGYGIGYERARRDKDK